jgi:ribosomal protein S17E
MGRIKPTMVKRATFELMHQDIEFNSDFEHNKNLLKDTMPSKKIRNKIAGYIARLKKAEKLENN